MKRKRSDIIITAVFLFFIYGVAIANLLVKDRTFSEMEKRILAQCPGFTVEGLLSGTFREDYETYVADQFVARDSFVKVKSLGERLQGKRVNNGVYYGKDGYLAEQLTELDEVQLRKNMAAVKRFVEHLHAQELQEKNEQTSTQVSFLLIPGSVAVNEERFSGFLPEVDQEGVIEELYDELAGMNVTCVDLYSMLKDHQNEELFYRTDHHWTSLGAYYGYLAFMEAKGNGAKAVPLSEYEETVRSENFYGTLYSRSGAFWIKPDHISTYVPEEGIYVERLEGNSVKQSELYVDEWLSKGDQYSMFLGGNQPLGVIDTGREELPKLLVIRDSFFDSMAPFLTPHYSQIHMIDFRYNRADIEQYMKAQGIDEVLICYSLANFHADKNLGYVLGR